MRSDIRSPELLAGIHPIRYGHHCMPATRFPFAICDQLRRTTVLVVAVLDERRDPDWIKDRLT